MKAKFVSTILLGLMLLSLAPSYVLANPDDDFAVGARYQITTITGSARAWIDGSWVIGPANLNMVVEVTYSGPHNVVFKVLTGTFTVRYKPYVIDTGHWRGDYNRDTHTAVYQGPATAPDGRHGYFVLFSTDDGVSGTGVYMHVLSDFRGEYGALWHIKMTSFRSRLS